MLYIRCWGDPKNKETLDKFEVLGKKEERELQDATKKQSVNGDDFFFPIFSSAEEMGEYGKNFSKIQKHILEVIPLARNNEKNVSGIVLNAFSDPFVLETKIFDIVENMKSRVEASKDTQE